MGRSFAGWLQNVPWRNSWEVRRKHGGWWELPSSSASQGAVRKPEHHLSRVWDSGFLSPPPPCSLAAHCSPPKHPHWPSGSKWAERAGRAGIRDLRNLDPHITILRLLCVALGRLFLWFIFASCPPPPSPPHCTWPLEAQQGLRFPFPPWEDPGVAFANCWMWAHHGPGLLVLPRRGSETRSLGTAGSLWVQNVLFTDEGSEHRPSRNWLIYRDAKAVSGRARTRVQSPDLIHCCHLHPCPPSILGRPPSSLVHESRVVALTPHVIKTRPRADARESPLQ